MSLLLPIAMAMALLVDRLFGEPPAWAHPVVGMGRYLDGFGKRLSALAPAAAFIGGALAWLLGAALVGVLAFVIESQLIAALAPWRSTAQLLAAAALIGLLLKPLLAWRMLAEEVRAVETALGQSVESGRQQLARLVSRDTTALSESEIREAAIETLAENLNDSVLAPLFWFAIAGLPGAAVYRFANTADAMWGYRDHREWSGKWAARADDALSWIPARLSALALGAWSPREARRTPSPNSGWPMAAMALRLGVSLGKPGVYRLNATAAAPRAEHVQAALLRARRAVWIAAPALGVLAWSLR